MKLSGMHVSLSVMLAACLFASCTFVKILWYNFSDIDDYKIFPHRELKPSNAAFSFTEHPSPSRVPATFKADLNNDIPLDDFLASNGTAAFLIIKNDTLLFEHYYGGHSDSSLSLTFSMAKSFFSILIGCAIDDGYITSVEQPVTAFVPELQKTGFNKVKIKHLLQMTSGMDYVESGNPFGIHTHFYYGSNLEERLVNLTLADEPGSTFEYKSGDNQLLGLILSRALRTMTITDYMQRRIWEPLGMEYGGLWSIDHEGDGLEKTFCCIAARARDLAKFGRLYLHHGNWNGKQIVSQSWVDQSTMIDTTEASPWNYQYGWWIVTKANGDYLAQGHLGQFVYVNPAAQVIIVRLGRSLGDLDVQKWKDLFVVLSSEVR